ncbi:MAG: type III pantothenate kinase [Saprospiraceae bacterium]|nr:type III pantothenate kinase [Saprospiraceae bacterium]
MTLAVDIGNSNIVVALYISDKWEHTFRYETKDTVSDIYYQIALRNILLEWQIHSSDIKNAVVSSVVPDLTDSIVEAIDSVTGLKAFILSPDIFQKLDIYIPHPYEIGSDLVANAYASIQKYNDKCIVVDFGTALSFIIVSKEKGIEGVTIAPGIKTAISSLSTQTAQLPVVPLELPKSVIGTDTISAIQAGVLYGYSGLVKEILSRMMTEKGTIYKVIATGGLSSVFIPIHEQIDHIDKTLTLEGMRLIMNSMLLKT